MLPLISVIVPIYNVEKYLKKCVDSIIAQTYSNLEIILVDDGSPDSCGAICDEYAEKDSRIKVVHKENGGLSSARNAGLDIATGEYIGFVDSDDYIASNMYENLFLALYGAERAISNCMYVRVTESGDIYPSVVPHTEYEIFSSEKFLEELLLHVGDVSVCTKLFLRDVIGELRFAEGVLNEDLLFMVEIIEKIDDVRFVGKVGYHYYIREGSTSSGYGKAIVDMQKNSLWVLDIVRERHPNLKQQAMRFALHQNMAYLLALPRELATRKNESYRSAKRFIRKNAFQGLFNKYLRFKFKIVVCALALMPREIARLKRKR